MIPAWWTAEEIEKGNCENRSHGHTTLKRARRMVLDGHGELLNFGRKYVLRPTPLPPTLPHPGFPAGMMHAYAANRLGKEKRAIVEEWNDGCCETHRFLAAMQQEMKNYWLDPMAPPRFAFYLPDADEVREMNLLLRQIGFELVRLKKDG